jgi:hypothetical protein
MWISILGVRVVNLALDTLLLPVSMRSGDPCSVRRHGKAGGSVLCSIL